MKYAHRRTMSGLALVSSFVFSASPVSPVLARDVASKPTTISSGNFDDYLMMAVDTTGKTLSGYYNDCRCRFIFKDALTPIELYQRADFGEAYDLDAWDPALPRRHFRVQIYSRGVQGFNGQVTLELSQNRAERPSQCRSRITLDREGSVSNDLIGVRVVSTAGAPVFDRAQQRIPLRQRSKREASPRVGTGVWVAKDYSKAPRRNYVYVNWYEPLGTPRGGYIREDHLFPMPRSAPK
jgi:hypothetical protein